MGVTALADSITSSFASISISPVGSSGLIVSGSRSYTSPVTVMTDSRCAFSTCPKKLREGWTTICVMP